MLLGAALILLGTLPSFWASHLMFFKSEVRNISDPAFFHVAYPEGFLEQKQSSPALRQFQRELPPELLHSPASLTKAIAIRHWVRRQQPDGPSWRSHPVTWWDRFQGDTENPTEILRQQRQGAWAVCKRFAYLFAGAAESAGLRARVIVVASTFYKSTLDMHVMTEIWIPELQSWVLMDAMHDEMYTVDQRPASALDVYQAVHSHHLDRIQTVHHRVPGKLRNAPLQAEFRHLYIALSNATFDGYRVCFACERPLMFAHFSSEFSPDYPNRWKRLALGLTGLTTLMGGLLWLLAAARVFPQFWSKPCKRPSWLLVTHKLSADKKA